MYLHNYYATAITCACDCEHVKSAVYPYKTVETSATARVKKLSRMLLDAEARQAAQFKFQEALSAEPAKKRRKVGPRGKKWACSVCLDAGLPQSKVMVCPQYSLSGDSITITIRLP